MRNVCVCAFVHTTMVIYNVKLQFMYNKSRAVRRDVWGFVVSRVLVFFLFKYLLLYFLRFLFVHERMVFWIKPIYVTLSHLYINVCIAFYHMLPIVFRLDPIDLAFFRVSLLFPLSFSLGTHQQILHQSLNALQQHSIISHTSQRILKRR